MYAKIAMRSCCLLVFLLGALTSVAMGNENWPQFRGPTGMGQTAERGLPTKWDKDGAGVLWKAPLPATAVGGKADHNQSSPIMWGEHVYVTTCFWPEGGSNKEFPEQHVTCYRLADGAQAWDVTVEPGPWLLSDLRGGYGAPTPATDGERLYAAFGSAVLVALDMQGKLLWRYEIPDAKHIDVAYATSPIVFGETVILLCDKNNKASTLTALDRTKGTIAWEQKRPNVAFAHSTPTLARIGDKPQLLVSASNALQGVDPTSGEILWWYTTPGDVCSPIYFSGLVYTDSGRGGSGVAIEPTGKGDLTSTNLRWKIPQIPEGLSSPVVAADCLYRAHTPGVLKCFDAKTGEMHFASRLEGLSTQASPIATPEGLVYFASAGKSHVLKAGPKLEVVATNDLGDASGASPAVAGKKLILKGAKYLWCLGTK